MSKKLILEKSVGLDSGLGGWWVVGSTLETLETWLALVARIGIHFHEFWDRLALVARFPVPECRIRNPPPSPPRTVTVRAALRFAGSEQPIALYLRFAGSEQSIALPLQAVREYDMRA